MVNENKVKIDLRVILHRCRCTLDNLNENSLLEMLREQNQKFDNALNLIEKYLSAAENVLDQDKAELGIKTATIFLISLWAKLRQGRTISELTNDDWKDILGKSSENAAMIDPQKYTLMVFDLYRRSIAFAIKPMSENASQSAISRMREIVSLMEDYDEALRKGDIIETTFIEENLWLSLEAVFIVLTDRMSYKLLPEERMELVEAASTLVFQKLRYSHYDMELAAIDECLDYQAKLDRRLTEQVNTYREALREELDEFDVLVEKAFSTSDFRAAFHGSRDLAELLRAEDILQSQADIDDYFIS